MAFTVGTYNVLASEYIDRAWYPFTSPELFLPDKRVPALSEHLIALDADILCLQEVEDTTFAAVSSRLAHAGYFGELTKKSRGRPDGCATFARTSSVRWQGLSPLMFHDQTISGSGSGHVAQIAVLQVAGQLLGVANTHLKWDSSGTPREMQFGYRQAYQLLEERSRLAPDCSGWIICGDMNATPESDVVALFQAAGFAFSHAGIHGGATCNANREAKMVDYLFYDTALAASAVPLPDVRGDTPLPGPHQPSDHVAVVALFDWRVQAQPT